jgi:hypothetical protein
MGSDSKYINKAVALLDIIGFTALTQQEAGGGIALARPTARKTSTVKTNRRIREGDSWSPVSG